MVKILVAGMAVLVLAAAAFSGGYAYDAYFARPAADAPAIAFDVAPGDSAAAVGFKLDEAGVIDGRLGFKTYVRLSDRGDAFKPGAFTLQEGMSYAAIVDALTRAQTDEVQITIPEGFTLTQIGERVRAALPHISGEEWGDAAGASSPVIGQSVFLAQNKPSNVDLEGYLFPDTYRFFADATAEDVVRKMVDAMEAKMTQTLASGERAELSAEFGVHDVLTLASIVEREVQGADDMKDVADIFLSRLEIGMPLQADSTISYYLGKTSAELTLEDLRADEPFNSYTRAGLPPGPISNPGFNAIDAVIHPTENPYLFFLTASDGTVIYASTFEAHVANKQRYLR